MHLMTLKKLLFITFVMLGCVLLAQPTRSSAAQPTLPPALQAAVQSGNASAITQAIQTLSAGNPARAAALALDVATVAQSMLSTNPQAAVNAVAAAIGVVQSQSSVMTSAPQQALQVAQIAARIISSDRVQQMASQTIATISIAVATVAANPAVYQSSPSAARGLMASAYTAANGISPTAGKSVTEILSAAAQSHPADAAAIQGIYAGAQRVLIDVNGPNLNQTTPPVDPTARNTSGS
jgi:hypothetical protein